MTQMLLFDATGQMDEMRVPAAPTIAETRIAETRIAGPAGADEVTKEAVRSHQSDGSPTDQDAVEDSLGVHRMGDLARLVLLRYELMAKRRARRAELRQQAESARKAELAC